MNVLASVLGLWSSDLGIDLGTANTLVHAAGRGVVIDEPSVVAVSRRSGQVVAVGTEASQMLGRTPADILALRPLQGGVIADFDQTEAMLRYFIAKAESGGLHVASPRVLLAVPAGVTDVEKRAVLDAARSAGAREAHLVPEPVAAAIGAGLPVQGPGGAMVVDVGGGTTEVAVLALGGVVHAESARVAGDQLDEAVAQYVRRHLNLVIGERTAEEIKIGMGSAFPSLQARRFTVRGRDVVTGLPRVAEMTTEHVRAALAPVLVEIIAAVRRALHAMPAELAADVVQHGLMLCGGGALLQGFAELIAHETLVPVMVAEDPLQCVVRGTARVLADEALRMRVEFRADRVRALRR